MQWVQDVFITVYLFHITAQKSNNGTVHYLEVAPLWMRFFIDFTFYE